MIETLEFINIIKPFSPTWGPNAVLSLLFQDPPHLACEREIQRPDICPGPHPELSENAEDLQFKDLSSGSLIAGLVLLFILLPLMAL